MAKMSNDERNRRRREQYAKRREAGLSRKEARAPTKAARTSYSVFTILARAADRAIRYITEAPMPTFEQWVTANPNMTKAALMREYRARGGKIGNAQGRRVIDAVRKPPSNVSRETFEPEYVPDFDPLIPLNYNRKYKTFGKARYAYIVSYQVEITEFLEPEVRYATVFSPTRLRESEVITIFYETMWDIQEHDERYHVEGIIDDSVQVIEGIDTENK